MASQIATVQPTVSLAWQAASSEERETDHRQHGSADLL